MCGANVIDVFKENEVLKYELRSIEYELQPTGVAICTYNSPESLNALTWNQRWESFALLEHMAKDENVRAVVWTGSGTRAFSSGADLKVDKTVHLAKDIRESMLARNMGPVKGDVVLGNLTRAFWDFPKPSICAVNGMAIGGAANIALVNLHDLCICSEKARFMYPFARLGFTPELGSSYLMPFLVGFAKTKELMFLGDWFSAQEAKEMGLVNKVVSQEALMKESIKLAERLVTLHPFALAQSKKILNSHIRSKLEDILQAENKGKFAAITIKASQVE